jgi:hypothetical protein
MLPRLFNKNQICRFLCGWKRYWTKKSGNLLDSDKKVQLDITVLVQRMEKVQYENAAFSYSETNNYSLRVEYHLFIPESREKEDVR